VTLATRFYLATATVAAVLSGVAYAGVRTDLAREAHDEATAGLQRTAEIMRLFIAGRPFDDLLADSLGSADRYRVTLIRRDGTVAGDSDIDARRLPDIENHAARSEVAAALRGEVGVAERASETVSGSLLYVAIPAAGGVLRLSAAAPRARAVAASARRVILGTLLSTLVVLFPLSRLLARGVERRLEASRVALSAMAAGDLSRRTRLKGSDLVGSIGETVDRAAETLGARLAESRQEADDLHALFDGLPEGLAYVDPGGVIGFANPAFEEWAGRAVPAGTRAASLFRSPDVLHALGEAMEGGWADREISLGERTLYMSARAHRGGALLTFRDLTALRRLQGVRRDFVANVSHELKTPLTSVVGFAEAIADGTLAREAAADFGTRILANATRMRRLVDDLLELSLIESGSWSPQLQVVDIAGCAREVWDELAPDRKRGVRLDIDDPTGARVNADGEATRQILRNLLDNACRYAAGAESIEVRVRPAGPLVRVEVRDRGPGIPAAHLERVFERFYRVDPGRSREEGGTGLGLSIVKHLVGAHGGEVGIESEVSHGTTVWFTLPVSISSLEGD
jgi:two-component system phosphate regulon sensor histidine kinase PhoR